MQLTNQTDTITMCQSGSGSNGSKRLFKTGAHNQIEFSVIHWTFFFESVLNLGYSRHILSPAYWMIQGFKERNIIN